MALPVAHWAVAFGAAETRDRRELALLGLFAVLPDFDFLLVLLFDFPLDVVHRTFSHSIFFALLISLCWVGVRPSRFRGVSAALLFFVVISHSLLDLLCTVEAVDHGVMLFWPLSDLRLGWPVLVPLYRLVAESPFSFSGAVRFTLLEMTLGPALWASARMLRRSFKRFGDRPLWSMLWS